MSGTVPVIAPVVEGHGDVEALPVLLRRLGPHLGAGHLQVPRPYRMPRTQLVRAGRLEVAVWLQADLVPARGGVLVVVDADDDCPATLGPELLHRAQGARPDKRIGLVLAKRELEAWFLAGLPDQDRPDDPENVRGAKERLKQLRGRYRPTANQAGLAATFDLDRARRHAPSFDKLCRELIGLIGAEEAS